MRAVGRRSAQQQRLKLFTTNYDLAFEHAASNTGFVVIDGREAPDCLSNVLSV